jgi:hypothetical protein
MKKRNVNLVVALSLLVFLLVVIIIWFSTQSFDPTGLAVSEEVLYEPISDYDIFNLEKGDIISGVKTFGVEVNTSKYNYYEAFLIVEGRYIEIGKGDIEGKISLEANTSEFSNVICGVQVLLNLFDHDKKYSFYSDSFSIVNDEEVSFINGEKIILKLVSEFGHLELKMKKNYEQIFYEDVRFTNQSVLMNEEYECAIDNSFPVSIVFNTSSFNEPKMFLNDNECKSYCNIIINDDDYFLVELIELGNFFVEDIFEFDLEIYNPSRTEKEYNVNEGIPFFATITGFDSEIALSDIDCFILLETEKQMELVGNQFMATESFGNTGLFDYGVRCELFSSGYKKEKFGKFEIR